MADSEGRLVCEGFEAWIVVGEKSLPLFGVECKESTREVSAWIPSEAGERFVVCYRKTGRDDCAYNANLSFDGHKIESVTHRHKHNGRLLAIKMISSVEISPTEAREFVFNPAVLTDDDAYIDHPSSAGIGEIKLILRPVKVTHLGPVSGLPVPNFRSLPEVPKIHERSKKGLVHQVQFSETKIRSHRLSRSTQSKFIGSPTIFIFKYRSLDLLRANGIAPRPTLPIEATEDVDHDAEVPLENSESSILRHGMSNVKQEDEEDGEDDDDNEIIRTRALLAELEERRNQKRARKEIGQSSKMVKKEFTCPFQPGEVIDLTKPDDIRPKKRVKTESTSHFALGEVIDLT